MVVSTSMVKGFQREISEKVFGFWGHIQVTSFDRNTSYENSPISNDSELIASLGNMNGVEHVQVYATKPGIIKVNDAIEGIIVKGVSADFDWRFLKAHIIEGQELVYHPDSVAFEIMISSLTASRLGVAVGDDMLVNFINPESMRIRSRKLKVTGIYNTGMEEYDKLLAYADIRLIEKLYNWTDGEIGGIEIFIENTDDLEQIYNRVYDHIGQDLYAQTIRQMRPSIFDWLDLQSVNERVILSLMIIVAMINMITALLILILERSNMVGILKAIGGSNWLIRRIFLHQAAYIITAGILLGNLFGLGMVIIQQQFGIITLPEKTYYVSVAPVQIDIWLILILNIATLVICLAALILPSLLVSRIKPVKVIRFK